MSDFDDDDDMLLELVRATQRPPDQPDSLYRARGEIAILRAQLEALQSSKNAEAERLRRDLEAARSAARGHIDALKSSVDKLEDEKRFLDNEIRALSAKRRKVEAAERPQPGPAKSSLAEAGEAAESSPAEQPEADVRPGDGVVIRVQDEWSQFCDFLHGYTINGSSRTCMGFLATICVEDCVGSSGFGRRLRLAPRVPVSSAVWEYLLEVRHLRLDALVENVCGELMALVEALLAVPQQRAFLAVPFLVCLVHASVTFKYSAVGEKLALQLVQQACALSRRFVALLVSADGADSFVEQRGTYQQRVLENFTLVACLDLVEAVVVVATQFGAAFVRRLWHTMDFDLLTAVFPENSERFKASAQINLVYNYVEMLSASLEGSFAAGDQAQNARIVQSLIKAFLIDISVKDDFMFFGLNRALGNNGDLVKICEAVPQKNPLNSPLVSVAFPVKHTPPSPQESFAVLQNHESHLLSLRLKMVSLLEALIVNGNMQLVNSKENIKSIVRIIGFEQNFIMHQPRSKVVHMRLSIISSLLRVLFYIIDENKNINTLIYPETLHEIFVILMRVAFSSDSLSTDAHQFLSEIRGKGLVDIGVFNKACEWRSREVAHFNIFDARPNKYAELSNIECDFANGVEFPYDSETIEIAREMLSVCVNHDEADNLYYNMNSEV
ncbi:DNA damage checkpoint family protein [Clavispora lusitaniae]|uniref:DNA damage checkpoint family protein n=1 Tax=Clavispora lusitaniae TaxID=36911 RepID=UPI00202C2AB1|nr:DNA damage checkpoint family protein [Clavispora lusitaniae]